MAPTFITTEGFYKLWTHILLIKETDGNHVSLVNMITDLGLA